MSRPRKQSVAGEPVTLKTSERSGSQLTQHCSSPSGRRLAAQLFINVEPDRSGPASVALLSGAVGWTEWTPSDRPPYLAVRDPEGAVRKRPARISSGHFHPRILYMETSHPRVPSIRRTTPGSRNEEEAASPLGVTSAPREPLAPAWTQGPNGSAALCPGSQR